MARKKNITKVYKRGYLKEVRNLKGRKKNISIGEGIKGWQPYYSGSKRSLTKKSYKNPEKLANRLAKSGHRKVRILD